LTAYLDPASSALATGWQGHLKLDFARQGERTLLAHRFVQAPMKVQRPFYPEGDVCHVVILHTAGGIVGGDRLTSEVHLQPQTHALLTTATAGKVYRSTGQASQITTRIQIAEGACLEWLPQETIGFDGAIAHQHTRIDLAYGALWIGWELTRFGRTARGERFDHGEWRSRTEVWQTGRLLWVDPQWVQGGSAMLTSSHGLAGCPVVGSFAVLGREVSGDVLDRARQHWQTRTRPQTVVPGSATPQPAPTAEAGVTRLQQGLLCRYRGHSTVEARRWFLAVWHEARLQLCDRPAHPPRVW